MTNKDHEAIQSLHKEVYPMLEIPSFAEARNRDERGGRSDQSSGGSTKPPHKKSKSEVQAPNTQMSTRPNVEEMARILNQNRNVKPKRTLNQQGVARHPTTLP